MVETIHKNNTHDLYFTHFSPLEVVLNHIVIQLLSIFRLTDLVISSIIIESAI